MAIAKVSFWLTVFLAMTAPILAGPPSSPYRPEPHATRIRHLRAAARERTQRFTAVFKETLSARLVDQGLTHADAAALVKRNGPFMGAAYLFILVRYIATREGREAGDEIFVQAAEAAFSEETLKALSAFFGVSLTAAYVSKEALQYAFRKASVEAARKVLKVATPQLAGGAYSLGAVAVEGTFNYYGVKGQGEALEGAVAAGLPSEAERRILAEHFDETTLSRVMQALDPLRVDYMLAFLEGLAFLGGLVATKGNPLLAPFACLGAVQAVDTTYLTLSARMFSVSRYRANLNQRLRKRQRATLKPVDRPPGDFARQVTDGLALHRLLLEQFNAGMARVETGMMDLHERAMRYFVMMRDHDLGARLRATRRAAADYREVYEREPTFLHFDFGRFYRPMIHARGRHLQMEGVANPPFSGVMRRPEHVEAFKAHLVGALRRHLQEIGWGGHPEVDPVLEEGGFASSLQLIWAGWQRATFALRALRTLRAAEDTPLLAWLDSDQGAAAPEAYPKVLLALYGVLDRDAAVATELYDLARKVLGQDMDQATLDAAAASLYHEAMALYEPKPPSPAEVGPVEEGEGLLGAHFAPPPSP